MGLDPNGTRNGEADGFVFQCSVNIVNNLNLCFQQKYKNCLIGLAFFHVVVDSFLFRKRLCDRITINRRLQKQYETRNKTLNNLIIF